MHFFTIERENNIYKRMPRRRHLYPELLRDKEATNFLRGKVTSNGTQGTCPAQKNDSKAVDRNQSLKSSLGIFKGWHKPLINPSEAGEAL